MKILNHGEKKPFNLEDVTKSFLNRMASEVTGSAKKENKSVSVFMKNLGNLTESELTYLTSQFLNLNPEIGTIELEKIVKIAKGEIAEDVPAIQKMQEEDISLRELILQNTDSTLENENNDTIKEKRDTEQKTEQKEAFDLSTLGTEETKTIKDCIESGLIENLVKVPSTMRKKLLDTINHSLEQRTRKIVEMAEKSKIVNLEDTPKVKKAEWGDEPR